MSDKKNGGHGSGGRGGAAVNRFPDQKQRPTDVKKGASNEPKGGKGK